jgi:F-type H+/Na+-transporting ATPase subunit alpha
MKENEETLQTVLDDTFAAFDRVLKDYQAELDVREIGIVESIGAGVAQVSGLPGAQFEELLRFPGGLLGMAYNLDPDEIGVILMDESQELNAGDEVHRTGRTLDVPVGEGLLGRVVDPSGRPIDTKGPIRTGQRRPIERRAPEIMDRAPVKTPLQTGIKAVDALIPIGRGQRELILGDRQTGKTAIAVDAILNQKGKDVICIYCAIGQRNSAVARVIREIENFGALEYTIVVAAGGEDPPGRQFVAPYAATSIGEYFVEKGRDVLIVYDDLTRHARAYRELSLLLRRPPGREAYPGDIFYIHSRLLERSTHLKQSLGGGSLTALPIIETEAQNISGYIPTNLISITDGQIYLSPVLFQRGILPAIDVGRSVSRVGGKAQLGSYRAVAGDLRLSYSQFQELEAFARFGSRLDEETRRKLERGYRVREILKQDEAETLSVFEQIVGLFAVTEGLFDEIAAEDVTDAERSVRKHAHEQLPDLRDKIMQGRELSKEDRDKLLSFLRGAVNQFQEPD